MNLKNTEGFTLIELLVVISIIGLLASVVLVSLNSARLKARDAKRIADFRQFQTALEMYNSDNSGVYPICSGGTVCTTTGYGADLATLGIAPSYISKIPKDPTNVSTLYGYYYAQGYKPTSNCGFVYTGATNNYILATRLENSAASPNSCPAGFGGWDNGSLNYLVGSGQ